MRFSITIGCVSGVFLLAKDFMQVLTRKSRNPLYIGIIARRLGKWQEKGPSAAMLLSQRDAVEIRRILLHVRKGRGFAISLAATMMPVWTKQLKQCGAGSHARNASTTNRKKKKA